MRQIVFTQAEKRNVQKQKKVKEILYMKFIDVDYQTIYRCRLCGELYCGPFTGNEMLALHTITCACIGIPSEEPFAPCLHAVHNCADGSFGVGDFHGYKKIRRRKQRYKDMEERDEN